MALNTSALGGDSAAIVVSASGRRGEGPAHWWEVPIHLVSLYHKNIVQALLGKSEGSHMVLLMWFLTLLRRKRGPKKGSYVGPQVL